MNALAAATALCSALGFVSAGCTDKASSGSVDLASQLMDFSHSPDMTQVGGIGFLDLCGTGFFRATFIRASEEPTSRVRSPCSGLLVADDIPAGAPCTETNYGPCQTQVCVASPADMSSSSPPDLGPNAPANARNIVITGLLGGVTLTLTPGQYAQSTSPNVYTSYDGGDTITFTAEGNTTDGNVPAFSGSVVDDGEAEVSAPQLNPGVPLPVSLTSDLVFTWSHARFGQFRVYFNQTQGNTYVSTVCAFPSSAQTGTVPHQAFTGFTPGGGVVSATSGNINTATVGGWTLVFGALNAAVQGASFGHPTMFQ